MKRKTKPRYCSKTNEMDFFFKQFIVVAAVHWNPLWEFITLNEFSALHNPKKKKTKSNWCGGLKNILFNFQATRACAHFSHLLHGKHHSEALSALWTKFVSEDIFWFDRNNSNTDREKVTAVRWNEPNVYPIKKMILILRRTHTHVYSSLTFAIIILFLNESQAQNENYNRYAILNVIISN